MTGFPKWVRVRGGVEIEIHSWEDLDEVVERYGSAEIQRTGDAGRSPTPPLSRGGGLAPQDRTLLQMFVENGRAGVMNRDIGPALGTQGKGIGPALERWSRRIGLVMEDSTSQPFERVNMGINGRGYRMTELSIRAAQVLLG